MLSVLIPCYNYDATLLLKKIHKQLIRQSFQHEIILIDDCSTNDLLDQKNKKIAEKVNAIYIKNKENLGRTATRQKLAKTARYDKLLFMDADVLPVNENFIETFNIENDNHDVIFGGITYSKERPEKKMRLRWTYGKAREAKDNKERLENPYLSIISQCFLIRKSVFLSANNFLENKYGVDIVFCFNLKRLNASIKHIENPILHLGLEYNSSFIKKTEKGLESLLEFEKRELIPNNFKKLQSYYQKLAKTGLNKIYEIVFTIVKTTVLRNLKSSNPSLLLFDLYRLYYFSRLHK